MDLPSLPELHEGLIEAAVRDGFSRLDAGGDPGRCCQGWMRPGLSGSGTVYLSAGIHGDEPAGPLALLGLLRDGALPRGVGVVMFPLLNPEGYAVGSRTNRFGVDLNRDYRQALAEETRRHLPCLDRLGRFEVAMCLHEDWEAKGVYLYEVLGPGLGSWAGDILEATDRHLGRDRSAEIDGHVARDGVISYAADEVSRVEREDWPEAFRLTARHTDRCYTLETPSAAALATRVAAQRAGVLAVIRRMG